MFKLFYPTKPFLITQEFGVNGEYYRRNGINVDGHNGLDIRAYHGQPVYATHDGEVTFAGEDGRAGLGVVIRTLEKYPYKDGETYFKTIYWHLKTGSIRVKPNQIVKAGEIIGLADNTGLSTGDHLHFGLKPVAQGEEAWSWWNVEQTNGYGGAIDPYPHFTGFFANEPKFQFTESFGFGDSGSDVVELQKYLGVSQTGYFGFKTLTALFAFQFKHGIKAYTGVVHKAVRDKLNS